MAPLSEKAPTKSTPPGSREVASRSTIPSEDGIALMETCPETKANRDLEIAKSQSAVHRKRLLLTLLIASSLFALEDLAPPCLLTAWASLLLLTPALFLGGELIRFGLEGLCRGKFQAETFVALGAFAVFLLGITTTILGAWGRLAPAVLEDKTVSGIPGIAVPSLGLSSAALLLSLCHLGKWLSTRKSAGWIKEISNLRPDRPAMVQVALPSGTVQRPVISIRAGDIVTVQAQERIPVDGQVVERPRGETAENHESPLWTVGDEVYAGTMNSGERIWIRSRSGTACVLSRAISLGIKTLASSSQTFQEEWRKISFARLLLTLAGSSAAVFYLISSGCGYGSAVKAALAALAAAWPGGYRLAWQAAQHAAMIRTFRRGIVIRKSEVLHLLWRSDAVLFHWSGTLTGMPPRVAEVISLQENITSDEVLFLAMVLEVGSEHPIAEGILRANRKGNVRTIPRVKDIQVVPGKGLRGLYQRKEIIFGGISFLEESGIDPSPARETNSALIDKGLRSLVLARDGQILGLVGMAERERPGAREVISAFQDAGARCILLTGDSQGTAERLARNLDLDEVLAELSPHDRKALAHQLAGKHRVVAALGHRPSDGDVLAASQLGIAVDTTDEKLWEAASAMIFSPHLKDLEYLIRCSREARKARNRAALITLGTSLLVLGAVVFLASWGGVFSPLLAVLAVVIAGGASMKFAGRVPGAGF